MADSTLPLNTGTGGKTLDTESLVGAGAVTVERQRLEIAGAALAEISRVINSAPAGTEYGLVVRPIAGAASPDTTASGSIAAAAATVALALSGQSGVAVQITGTWVGTLQFEATVDGTNWSTLNAVVAGSGTPSPITTANGLFRLTPAGLAQIRVNATAWTSGTATVTMRASVAAGGTFINQSLTAGTNTIGSVKLTDGTNVVAVKPASTASVAADTAQVVALHPTSPLPAGTNTIGTVTLGADPDTTASASITATDAVVGAPAGSGVLLNGTSTANSYVAVFCPGGDTVWTLQLTGTFGGGTVYYEASLDSTTGQDGTWAAINGRQTGIINTTVSNGTTVAGFFRGNTSGIKYFRVRMVGATSPSVAVLIRLSSGQGAVFLNASIPGGANTIGSVKPTDGTNTATVKAASTAAVVTDTAIVVAISPNNPISVSNPSVGATGTTAPTSAALSGATASTAAPALTAGQMSALSLTLAGGLRVDASATTQPISAASLPLPTGAATAANQTTLGSQTSKINDGTNTAAVKAASTAAVAVDPSLVVALHPTSPLPAGTNAIGTVTAAQGAAAAAAGAWPTKITDGTNVAAVKAASTAAVATDTAQVVAISPNNAVTVSNPDVTSTGALGALNAAVQVSTAGLNTAGFQLAAGTLIGTIVAECSFDGGTTWVSTYFDTAANGKVASIVFASANTATAATVIGVGGTGLSRIRVSAFTSGTANITLRATTRSDPSLLYTGSPGSALPPSTGLVGGTDGTLLRALLTDSAGRQIFAPGPNIGTQTHSVGVTNIAVVASAQDIFTITGSATKTIRVNHIRISGTATAASVVSVLLVKRSTANTGGTSQSLTTIAHDSNNASATATVLAYTANPTAGTALGNLRSSKMSLPVPGSAPGDIEIVYEFGTRPGQALVLRGIAQVVAINLAGNTITGGAFNVTIEWTEE